MRDESRPLGCQVLVVVHFASLPRSFAAMIGEARRTINALSAVKFDGLCQDLVMAGLVPAIHVFLLRRLPRLMPGTQASEATPFFERLRPGMTP